MAMTFADFEAYMDRNTNQRLTEIDGRIETGLSNVRQAVGKLESSVRANSDKLDTHDEIIRKNQHKIGELADEMLKIRQLAPTAGPSPGNSGAVSSWASVAGNTVTPSSIISSSNKAAYLRARRSLRLWPVEGGINQELWESVRCFIGTTLGMGGQVQEHHIECIVRPTSMSGPGVEREVIVTFKEAAVRDDVMGNAGKLAPFISHEGRSTAGMRMEVPDFLKQQFRTLFRYGQTLRGRHGQGTRRHVKFDDGSWGLYLNVRLPSDDNWSKVSVQVAERGMRAQDTIRDGELERRLDITGPFRDPRRPKARAASTS